MRTEQIDTVVIVPMEPQAEFYWRSRRRHQFPTKMPRKMKRAVRKIFDGQRLHGKEERRWLRALRAARHRLADDIRRGLESHRDAESLGPRGESNEPVGG